MVALAFLSALSSFPHPPNPYTHAASAAHGTDNTFRAFRKLCERVAATASHNDKTAEIREFLTKGSEGTGFTGDLYMTVRLLMLREPKRVYNMKDKAIVRVMSNILGASEAEMTTDLDKGDCPQTCADFFKHKATRIKPQKKSTLTVPEVYAFLSRMEGLTTLEQQQRELEAMVRRCTPMDLLFLIRFLKHDLRTFCGAKAVLGALHDNVGGGGSGI